MNKNSFIAIIPARYASTRFPGKPLALIGGIPMIERVYRRAQASFEHVLVATDDNRIADVVRAFGGNVVMTSPNHRSGTDRCSEAYRLSGSDADIVVNIQGDEPFIAKSQLEALKLCFEDESVQLASLARPFPATRSFEELANPNSPKVVMDSDMNAMLFSRSVIPFLRGVPKEKWPAEFNYFTHVGLYGYRADVLGRITLLPQSKLELAESLEQLRWLENGYKIRMAVTEEQTIGIDTPADLEAAERLFATGKFD